MEKQIKNLRNEIEESKRRINEFVKKRDELNKSFSQFLKDGKKNKKKRNEVNLEKSKILDKKRKELDKIKEINQKINLLREKKEELSKPLKEKRAKNKKFVDPERLRDEAKRLEWKLETSVLSMKDEKKIIKRIGELRKGYENFSEFLQVKDELKALYQEKDVIKKSLDELNKKLDELSRESQKYHERMKYSFDRAKEIKKKADEFHNKFLSEKKRIDEVYREYKKLIEEKIERETEIIEKKIEKKVKEMKKRDNDLKRKADEIYKKFLKGEKLSTEDLMILQSMGNFK